jgi:drug/metabolite transporter (DMT)-like permease
MTSSPTFLRFTPAMFVILWSSGWIAAGVAMHYAEPLTFLSVRFALAAGILGVACVAMGVEWPRSGAEIGHALMAGVLLHGLYLTGVWGAVMNGLPVAISGLIAALQPILTALLAPWLLGETITRRQWAGVAVGFVGMATVLQPALAQVPAEKLQSLLIPLAVNLIGIVSVTFGTFYQKRFVASGDLRAITVLQNVGALAVTIPLALLFETLRLEWNVQTALTMAWSVFGMSFGAVALLLLLIRHGAVSRAAALIYLMPPMVAVQAMLFLGESLTIVQMAGIAVTAAGVALVVKTPSPDDAQHQGKRTGDAGA